MIRSAFLFLLAFPIGATAGLVVLFLISPGSFWIELTLLISGGAITGALAAWRGVNFYLWIRDGARSVAEHCRSTWWMGP